MGKKQTKRQRKFQTTGGVKGRLEKGTISSKGGARHKRKAARGSGGDSGEATANRSPKQPSAKIEKVDRSDDLLSQQNLGNLDIDSFFAQFAEDDHDDEEASTEQQSDESSALDGNDEDPKGKEGKRDSVKDSASSSDSSSGSDDDEEDDIEAAERRMKAEMSLVQQNDPEFHDFLKENEESLLEFGQEEDADKEEMEEEEEPESKSSSAEIHLTPKLLSSLAKGALQQHGVKSLKKLVTAYKSACFMADGADSDTKHRPGESGQKYQIDSSKVFDDLMVLCLNHCYKEFEHHLLPKNQTSSDEEKEEQDEHNKPINPKTLEKAERWTDLRPILVSFFRSTLHVMSEAKEPDLLAFVLKALSKYLRYLTPFPRIAENMLKSLTVLWSAPLDASENYQVVRVNAFLRIRQLALTQPFPFIEDCLKKTYLAYAKRAKFGSSASSAGATLTFMGNCLVELYSLDFDSSYQHAFVYIRQLALLLRTAMQKKTPEAMQQVYCWQYVHCLKLWVAVLSKAVPADDGALLRSLVYPLTEVILGTIRLVPSPVRHLPLRFHCVRLLQQLAASTEVFIPTTSLLLDCLEWKEWTLSPKKTKSARDIRGLQLSLMLKLGKEDPLRSHEQLEAAMNEFFVLLHREVGLYRYSAGFPEFSIRIVVRLRQFSKETRNPRFRAYAKACIDLCDMYSKFAVQARSKLQEAPKDVKLLECLKPTTEKTMRERHEESIEKEQKALEASRPSSASAEKKRDEPADSDSDGSEVSEKEEMGPKRKKQKQKKQKKTRASREELEKQMLPDDELMEEQDQVEEGVDWSDED